jgi:thiosulfate/3-mercaptopyruvate sulfurtransferase
METLVSTQWLARELDTPDLVVLDASKHLPSTARDAAAEYRAAHIPGALFLDLTNLANAHDPVPGALPTRAQFDARLSALGVTQTSRVVLYDNSAMRTSARAWFVFRHFGVSDVAVLDGGMQKWQAEERPVEQGEGTTEPTQFASEGSAGSIRNKGDLLANIKTRAEQVIDARDGPRFRGEVPDIRPNMPTGHIPHSCNLPFASVLNLDSTFKDKAGIREAFEQAGIDLDKPVIATCGSGVTASVLVFALHLLGKDAALYDGSWSEWGANPDMPIETGPGAVEARV